MSGKLLKSALWALSALFATVVLAYVALLTINLNDRPPSDAFLSLEEDYRNRPQVPDTDNAYVYMLGFDVPPGEEPTYWGQKRVRWMRQLRTLPPEAVVEDYPGDNTDSCSARSPAVRALGEACETADAKCMKALESGKKALAEWLSSEQWRLDRYRQLLSYGAWGELVPFDERAPLLPFSEVLDGQRLLMLQAFERAGQGDAQSVKDLLTEDIRFWRHVLAHSDILITKLIAASVLQRHFSWSNLILRRLPPETVMRGVPDQWRVPVSHAERSMHRCLTGEMIFFHDLLKRAIEGRTYPVGSSEYDDHIGAVSWLLLRPLVQIQDTSNRYAELVSSIDAVLDVPYPQLPDAAVRARRIEEEAVKASAFPSRAYNLLGDVLFGIGGSNFTSYALRIADLEGIRRLALLTAELRSQEISPSSIEGRLDAMTKGPYGTPFRWDAARGSLVFDGLFARGEPFRLAY